MSWRTWLAEKIAPIEKNADAEISEHAPAARGIRARYLVAAMVLALCVGGYAVHWLHSRVKVDSSLKPVATQGGTSGVYSGPPTSAMAKADKQGVRPRAESRPVKTYRTEDLPKEEQNRIPVTPPPPEEAKAPAVADGCLRDGKLVASEECRQKHPLLYRATELASTGIVPPHRGDTDIRASVTPAGDVIITAEPKREPFVGWPWKDGNWKRVEIEGRYGLVGNTQAKATARWMPLRLGAVQFGAEGSVGVEIGGITRTEVMALGRWEPFRDSYR